MIMVVDSFHISSAVPVTAHTLRLIIPIAFHEGTLRIYEDLEISER